jgi:hypothetical protein
MFGRVPLHAARTISKAANGDAIHDLTVALMKDDQARIDPPCRFADAICRQRHRSVSWHMQGPAA